MVKALVIDDNKLIRWSIKEIFLQDGHQVDAVATANEALEKAKNDSYGLIFADFEIDNVISIDLLHKLHELQPRAQLVILSGMNRKQIEPQLKDLTVFKIIAKPFDTEEIRHIARETLNLT